MIVVIIAGGSGTRLWPLSTSTYPKHLLKLTNEKSLLQNTLARVEKVTSLDKIFVITEASHSSHVLEQLSELDKDNILTEPARRGTASCVAYALSELRHRNMPDEPILFVWADNIIKDDEAFAATILKAGEIAQPEQKMVFIGLKPTFASTGFGYIERGELVDGWQDAYKLMRFKEKPDQKTAEEFLKSGNFFWNTGYLVSNIGTLEREIQTHAADLWRDYQKLLVAKDTEKTYLDFDQYVLEYVLSEKVKDGIVVPGSFDWVDVGSFRDLHDICKKDELGNHTAGKVVLECTSNSLVRNETDVPVAVIGVDNVVVINTPDGVLVVNKDLTQKVKDVAQKIQS
jgi:mannose-1-phosphate guanylyltransferase